MLTWDESTRACGNCTAFNRERDLCNLHVEFVSYDHYPCDYFSNINEGD